MVDTSEKFEALKATYDLTELDLMLEKLLDVALNQHRQRLARYDQQLARYEEKYELDSQTFAQRFETGEMGDAMDYFEWMGIYALRQDLIEKIRRLESVV
jgi:hypothetical protein